MNIGAKLAAMEMLMTKKVHISVCGKIIYRKSLFLKPIKLQTQNTKTIF